MGYEDTGLRAKIDGVGQYVADAKRVQDATRGIAREAQASAKATNQGVTSMMTMLKGFAGVAVASYALYKVKQAATDLAGGLLSANAAWEQYSITFETMLGSSEAAAAHMEELSTFARKTPFELTELVEASKQLQAYGFEASDIVPILTDVGDATAALGREKMPYVIRALGQMRTRTKVTAQEMLQLTEAGIPAWQILADAMEVPVSRLQDMVSQGIVPADRAIVALLDGMNARFGGLMQAQSESFDGMISNLEDWAYRAKQIGGEGFFEAVKGELRELLNILDTPIVENKIREMGEALGDFAGGALEMVDQVIYLSLNWDVAMQKMQDVGVAVWDVITAEASLALWGLVGENVEVVNALLDAWYDLQDKIGQIWHSITAERKVQAPEVITDQNLRDAERRGRELRERIDRAVQETMDPNNYGLGPMLVRGIVSVTGAARQLWEQEAQRREEIRKEIEEATYVEPYRPVTRTYFDPVDATRRAEEAGERLRKAQEGWQNAGVLGALDMVDAYRKWKEEINSAAGALDSANRRGVSFGQGIVAGADNAKAALSGLKDEARELEAALREAENAMRAFADPRFTGMQEMEDEMFALEQAAKQAELNELLVGDAAQKTAKKVRDANRELTDTFDLLGAQQRELAEGIPVPFQRAMHEIEQAEREAARAQDKVETPAPAAGGDEETESQRLRRLLRIKQLQYEITFDPLKRNIQEIYEDLTGANQEVDFADAVAGLLASYSQTQLISAELETNKALQDQVAEAMTTQDAKAGSIYAARNNTAGAEEKILGAVAQENEKLQTELDLLLQIDAATGRIKQNRATTPPPSAANPVTMPGGMKAYGAGGDVTSTGWALVGERGPEIVRLPAGARVYPNDVFDYVQRLIRLPKMAGGGEVRSAGAALVGERGPEPVLLPAAVRALPAGALAGQAAPSRTYNDTYNIYGVSQPIDVWHTVQSRQRLQRMYQGR